jgi:MEDS: MEthanogen/methylotroph, DcmR Sensory domain
MHPETAPAFHAVRFYDSPESICQAAAEFIGEAIAVNQPALVIIRAERRALLLDDLRERGIDVDALLSDGDLLVLDARDTLAALMVNGQPSASVLDEQAAVMFQRLCRGRKDCTIWAYGEMVDLLWEADNPVAAMLMEILWNRLAASWKLCILCGYSVRNVYKDANIADIVGQHTHAFGVEAALSASGGQAGDHPGG